MRTAQTTSAFVPRLDQCDLVAANATGAIDASSRAILEAEKLHIHRWRRAAGADRPTHDLSDTLSALALSGGGIRSATFALGITQAFAARDLMSRFDYLSTVSGGGYLGASLTWLTRPGTGYTFGQNTKDLRDPARRFPYPVDPPAAQQDRLSDPQQDAQLIYLRQHGKYLTPGRGLDVLSLVAVVLRGFLLNLLVWSPVISAALFLIMAPWPFWPSIPWFGQRLATLPGFAVLAALGAGAALLFALASLIYSLATYLAGSQSAWRYHARRKFEIHIRYLLWTVAITVPIVLLPFIYDAQVRWLASAGLVSVLGGLGSAVGTFLRLRSGNGQGGLGMSVVAPLGAALMLYGIVLLGYAWAGAFYACTELGARQPLPPFQCAAPWMWELWIGVLGVALVSGYFVNVNLLSLHRFYRDRLMEAFLPDPLPASEPPTHEAQEADVARLHAFSELARDPTGPYHLINTNLILVHSQDRVRRTRGGDSFVLSPLYCGSNATGWCSTRNFLGGDLTLATAMAISGAAANPNAGGGIYRHRPVAVLMALTNIRLGYWVSHPDPAVRMKKRRSHFDTAWRELTGKLDETRRLLQLSDGGHFDNLGVYELIRRRVRLIVACDGTADPDFAFADFIALLARIEADFGARIEFSEGAGLEVFMPSAAAGFPRNAQLARRGFTVGKIRYADGTEGDLIYLTTTLFKGLGLQTLGYCAAHEDFPDQSTADQFFDDAQFEAYRQLGYSLGAAMLDDPECRAILAHRVGMPSLPSRSRMPGLCRRLAAALGVR